MRILITGSREFTDRALMKEAIQLFGLFPDAKYAHGDAGGADKLSENILVNDFNIPIESIRRFPVPAKAWLKYGKAAGVLRNQYMLVEFKPDLVLAFFKSGAKNKGTGDMMDRSIANGVRVITTTQL